MRTSTKGPFDVARPPWTQPLTARESDRMLAAAREVGGDVERWAITAHYVQSALADRVERFERAMRWSLDRGSRRDHKCGYIHGNKPKGWTCLDTQLDAELHPDRYGGPYATEVRAGLRLCHFCVLVDALGEFVPHPDHDWEETGDAAEA